MKQEDRDNVHTTTHYGGSALMPKLVGMCGGDGSTSYCVTAQREEVMSCYPVLASAPPSEHLSRGNRAESTIGFIDRTTQSDGRSEQINALARIFIYEQCNEVKKQRVMILSVEGDAMACGRDLKQLFKYDILDVQPSKVVVALHTPTVQLLGRAT